MSRDYVFTSWEQPRYDESKLRYICWGLERCPTTDKQHWQGFAVFTRTHRINGAKQIINGGDGIHLESRRGTRQQAVEYCRKGGEFYEWGSLEKYTQKELLQFNIKEIKSLDPLFYVRYNRGIEKYKYSDEGEPWRELFNTWYWGEARVGKTREVMKNENVYKLDYPYTWWDGYDNNEIILIDNIEDQAIQRGYFLNILDGYPLRLPTKGGHTYAHWRKVFITSNKNPEDMIMWNAALRRRIHKTVKMCNCASG